MSNAPAAAQSNLPPPAETRAERRMRRLEQMADMGVNIGRRLERQAELASTYADSSAVPDNLPHSRRLDEIARSFAQVCRAVAIATALEDRIDQGLPALPELDRARRLRERAADDKRAAVRAGVEHALDADPAITSRRRLVGLKLNLDRLLDQEALDLDLFLDRPLPQIVERLRRQLGLDPIEDEAELWRDEAAPAPRARNAQEDSNPQAHQGHEDLGELGVLGGFKSSPALRAQAPPAISTPNPAETAKRRRGRFARHFPPTRGP